MQGEVHSVQCAHLDLSNAVNLLQGLARQDRLVLFRDGLSSIRHHEIARHFRKRYQRARAQGVAHEPGGVSVESAVVANGVSPLATAAQGACSEWTMPRKRPARNAGRGAGESSCADVRPVLEELVYSAWQVTSVHCVGVSTIRACFMSRALDAARFAPTSPSLECGSEARPRTAARPSA